MVVSVIFHCVRAIFDYIVLLLEMKRGSFVNELLQILSNFDSVEIVHFHCACAIFDYCATGGIEKGSFLIFLIAIMTCETSAKSLQIIIPIMQW